MDNSKASTPLTAGACPSKRKIPSSTTHGEAQHREIRNKSQSTPTRRGTGSASEKTQRSPTVVDPTEDDGPGLHADVIHLCKKLCTEFATHIQHKQDVYHSTIMADAPAPADANIVEDAEEFSGVKEQQNSTTDDGIPDFDYDPFENDAVPAVPVQRVFNAQNGRWTYSDGDRGHFVRIP